jgi:polyribonucleotide nucleotidyltransferase
MDFGAFVRISEATGITGMKDTEGLVHVSEIAPFRIGNVRDAVAEGERVPVVIKEIDEMGRVNLSIKHADPEWATKKGLTPAVEPPGGWPERPPRPHGDRPHGPRGGFGGPRPPHREGPPHHA